MSSGEAIFTVSRPIEEYLQASWAETTCEECHAAAETVLGHLREEIRCNLELTKALEEGNRPAGELHRPGLWVDDLIGIDDLRLDAVRPCIRGCIDELPGPPAIAAV